MPEVPFQLQYTLSRSQRLIPHLGTWGLLGCWGLANLALLLLILGFFCTMIAAWAIDGNWRESAGFAIFAVGLLFLFQGLFRGLLDVIRVPARPMDILFQENAAGILIGDERWWLFLDGITSIEQYRNDVWTIRHWNGSVLNIPTSAITDDQMQWIRAAMERGRTPEGRQAVIERGRRIEPILIQRAEERRKKRRGE
jgi:hypothetical protein